MFQTPRLLCVMCSAYQYYIYTMHIYQCLLMDPQLINRFIKVKHIELTGRYTRALKEPTHRCLRSTSAYTTVKCFNRANSCMLYNWLCLSVRLFVWIEACCKNFLCLCIVFFLYEMQHLPLASLTRMSALQGRALEMSTSSLIKALLDW